jgi:hypothetical protein
MFSKILKFHRMALQSCHIALLACARSNILAWIRREMNFELVRIGWPNTAAILALALMPMASLATMTNHGAETATAQIRSIDIAAFYPPNSVAIVAANLRRTFTE